MRKMVVGSAVVSAVVSCVASGLLVSPAWAEAEKFVGSSVALQFNAFNSTAHGMDTPRYKMPSLSGESQSIGVDLRKTIPLGGRGVLAFGAQLDPMARTWLSKDSPQGKLKSKVKLDFGMYVAPGYVLNDNTMLYGKVGYRLGVIGPDDSSSEFGSGYDVGLGGIYRLDDNWFLQGELAQRKQNISAFDNQKFDEQVVSLGVGLRF